MITNEDRETVRRVLGDGPVPQPLADELELRTFMYHKGCTGPIGVNAVIDAIRFVGLGELPKILNEPMQTMDFWNIPINARIWVKDDQGVYRPAAFTGTNAGGSVAIRWDGGMEVITVPAFRCLRHEPHVKITGQPVVVDSPLASTSTDADELALEAMIRDEMAAGVK